MIAFHCSQDKFRNPSKRYFTDNSFILKVPDLLLPAFFVRMAFLGTLKFQLNSQALIQFLINWTRCIFKVRQLLRFMEFFEVGPIKSP